MTAAMMKCGHTANANRIHDDGSKTPACAICAGFTPDAEIVVDGPDVTGRLARCSYYGSCGSQRTSTLNGTLAFFEHLPDREHDRFYCGCLGWD